jgi:ABC-type bacteriocin/lantibiotic exporter with double-glycine peptidase domain
MNLIFTLLEKFVKGDIFNISVIIVSCFVVNIIETYGITSITAKIIKTVEEFDKPKVFRYFCILVFLYAVYVCVKYVFSLYQNILLTKLWQWMKTELTKIILVNNHEDFASKNFVNMLTPINRTSFACFMIISDIITFIMPMVLFLVVITGYLAFTSVYLAAAFIAANLFIALYFYFVYEFILDKNKASESTIAEYDAYILEILGNIDRVIYRGQIKAEIETLNVFSSKAYDTTYGFYKCSTLHGTVMNILVYVIVIGFIYHFIRQYLAKKIDLVVFITLLSIFALYRDNMASAINQIQDFIEFFGRMTGALKMFENMDDVEMKKYSETELTFYKIRFADVSFKYKSSREYIFKNFSKEIFLDNKIIGVTGISGRGKSTFMKLILKMHKGYTGNIYIDDVNLRDIDPNYIRQNITYVNQNSKLFDRIIVENMMYGCIDDETCKSNLQYILDKYPKINALFKEKNIYNFRSGPLGEKLSGGQRQVVNIIGGLINPSPIVFLDEPTNALDGELKKEVLALIAEFRKYKKCIVIVTHDRDVFGLFDENVSI